MPKSLSMQIPTSLFKKSTESYDSEKAPLKAQRGPTASSEPPASCEPLPQDLSTLLSTAINLLDYCSNYH